MRFTDAICDPARSEVYVRGVPRIEIEVFLALIQGQIAAPTALVARCFDSTAGRSDVGSFTHGRAFSSVCPPDAVLRNSEMGLQQKRQLHRAPTEPPAAEDESACDRPCHARERAPSFDKLADTGPV